jgi:hypothetical protein
MKKVIGPWRSLASALAWGARGPEFKSRRPDQTIQRVTNPTLLPHPSLESIWSPNGVHASRYQSVFRWLPRSALCFQQLGIHGVHGCHQRGLVRWWRKHLISYKGTTTSPPGAASVSSLRALWCPSLSRRLPRPALCFQQLGIHGAHGYHPSGLFAGGESIRSLIRKQLPAPL